MQKDVKSAIHRKAGIKYKDEMPFEVIVLRLAKVWKIPPWQVLEGGYEWIVLGVLFENEIAEIQKQEDRKMRSKIKSNRRPR